MLSKKEETKQDVDEGLKKEFARLKDFFAKTVSRLDSELEALHRRVSKLEDMMGKMQKGEKKFHPAVVDLNAFVSDFLGFPLDLCAIEEVREGVYELLVYRNVLDAQACGTPVAKYRLLRAEMEGKKNKFMAVKVV